MIALEPEQFHARSLIYHALAHALYEPQNGLLTSLREAVIRGGQVLGSAACQAAALALTEVDDPPLSELVVRYRRAIRGSGQRPLAFYESLYRENRLLGQATRETELRYRGAGIHIGDGELPDHASVELTFLGHLTAAQAEAYLLVDSLLVSRLRMEEHAFLRDHPGGWLPELGRALAASGDPFYGIVGSLLHDFLHEELTSSWYRQAKRAGFPTLRDADNCNLCGICIGACVLGAMGMVENDKESALVLDTSRCLGCNRCVRTCPSQALAEAAVGGIYPEYPADGDSPLRILRRSSRARCPVCSDPTVSQAELQAVFAAVQPDPVLARQMSLCVECKSMWNSW